MLGDVPDEALLVAASEYLKSANEWRPVPGKLRQRVLELCHATPDAAALEAWNRYADIDDAEMMTAARAASDQIAVDAIRQMRSKMWRLNGDADTGEIMAERMRAFCELYRELAARAVLVALPAGVKREYARIGSIGGQ